MREQELRDYWEQERRNSRMEADNRRDAYWARVHSGYDFDCLSTEKEEVF